MVDFSTYAPSLAEAGVAMPVRDPNGKPLDGVTITVAGGDSERVRRIQRANWNGRRVMGGRRGGVMPTAEEAEADALATAVAATLAWTGIEFEGKALDCTPENAKMLYARVPVLRRQVEQFRDDELNFISASAGV